MPDITAPGAYDEAVRGARFVIHVASPFANPALFDGDAEEMYILPAVKGTVGMLESAAKEAGVERVVVTASIYSTASFAILGTDTVVNGKIYTPSLTSIMC